MEKVPNIVFARVDNRLIHGQVGMVWSNTVGANLIIVVDDEVSKDPIRQKLMKITVSTLDIGIRFWSVDTTIKNIWNASEKQKIFILTENVQTMEALIDANIPIKEVNLGNMHSGKGKKRIAGKYIYADEEDIKSIENIKKKNIEIYAQVLPDYEKIII